MRAPGKACVTAGCSQGCVASLLPRGVSRNAAWITLLAGVLRPLAAAAGPPPQDAWQTALAARAVFEAQPAHSRAEYSRLMDRFRAIYHSDPGDPHAARAIGQVGELLTEQGQEMQDRKSLRDAAGQYEFLAKEYPANPLAPEALDHAAALLGPDAADDPAELHLVRAQLARTYPRFAPRSALPTTLRTEKILREQSSPQNSSAPGATAPTTPERPSRTSDVTEPAASADSNPQDRAGHTRQRASERSPADDTAPSPEVAEKVSLTGPRAPATVTAIRHWSTPTYTRVAIDLGDEVHYQAARVQNPDRIFFDLHHARLAPQLVGKSFAVTDEGFLTRIRAAQFSDDVTRVVLDVHQVSNYSAFLLPNPYRLIIDIHGGPESTGTETLSASVGAASNPAGADTPHTALTERSLGSDGRRTRRGCSARSRPSTSARRRPLRAKARAKDSARQRRLLIGNGSAGRRRQHRAAIQCKG